ncbi:MAG: hypothetical protein JWM11_3052 [Planctomycetaceae bacterium]|nr:hypothetical protein [Planctomycetaceae bacterium]
MFSATSRPAVPIQAEFAVRSTIPLQSGLSRCQIRTSWASRDAARQIQSTVASVRREPDGPVEVLALRRPQRDNAIFYQRFKPRWSARLLVAVALYVSSVAEVVRLRAAVRNRRSLTILATTRAQSLTTSATTRDVALDLSRLRRLHAYHAAYAGSSP